MNGSVDLRPLVQNSELVSGKGGFSSEKNLSNGAGDATPDFAGEYNRLKSRDQPIGILLKELGLVTIEEVERIVTHARSRGLRFGEAAVALGLLSPEDLRRVLAFQFNLPLARASENKIDAEVVAAYDALHPIVEDLRALRDQLLLRWISGDGPEHRTIAIVSPSRREGRSFLAANLAVTFAQIGFDVLLVDADLRRGRLHQMFGVDGSIGLSTLLSDRKATGAVRRIEQFGHLSVLPSGGEPPNPADLLIGERFTTFLQDATQRHDLVLLDSPAAQTAPETLAIAARAQGNVMVARNGLSRVRAFQELAREIGEVGGVMIGTVLSGA